MKLLGFNFGKDEPRIENYLFLQKILIKALDIVFTGYKTGEYFFVPPDSVIDGYYQYLHQSYDQLNNDPIVNGWLKQKNLPFTSLHTFHSLIANFDVGIEFWNSLSGILLKEYKFLLSYVPHDAYVTEKLTLTGYEMEKLLDEHKKLKESVLFKKQNPLFVWRQFSIDTKIGRLTVHDQNFDVNPNTKPFLFLTHLIQNCGNIVRYKELGSILRINAYNEKITDDKDIARSIQDYKKLLKSNLDEIGVNSRDTRMLMDSIRSITNTGYRLEK